MPDGSQTNIAVNIVYKVGSRHEGYGESGMAHLLEHMLFKQCKKFVDIKKAIADKGAQANGTTWYDRTNYYEIFQLPMKTFAGRSIWKQTDGEFKNTARRIEERIQRCAQ